VKPFLLSFALLLPVPSRAVLIADGPAALAGYAQGQSVSSFTVKALYLNASDEPMGARFIHASGMPVDVLFFASVPQTSIYFRTLPVSESGDSHTLEHLLLGKGRVAKYMNSLMEMRLGEHTAATYSDLTNYQVRSAAGPEGFYELLEAYLRALLKPDFTDEEIRREVANFEAVPEDGGRLRLEEKGTVYNEMVSTMEKAEAVNWDRLGRLIFGPEHPLARNQGGRPDAIWKLTPADIRRYHDANYHFGPNMELVAALPMDWSAEAFLKRLDEMMRRIEPQSAARSYPSLPKPTPALSTDIQIGSFPSDDASVPQTAIFAWRPSSGLNLEEEFRLNIALDIIGGGETSYLYKDLVDQKTRTLDVGATGVGAEFEGPPSSYASVTVGGLPVSSITPETLEKVRSLVLGRVRWLAGLQGGSAELEEVAEKARSLISAGRRGSLKFMDSPPQFGDRSTPISWHRHLDELNAEGGFRKSVPLKGIYDALLHDVNSGGNPWKRVLEKAGLLSTPYVGAVRPDPALLAKDKTEKAARMAAGTAKLEAEFKTSDGQAALGRYKADSDVKTAELEALDRQVPRPSFVKDPPLTLDDVEYSTGALFSGPKLTRAWFGSTPFTHISIHFDLSGVPEKDLELLPLLSSSLSELGAKTRTGETLDYVKAQERVQSEIYSFGVGTEALPVTDRYELTFSAAASSPEEVDKADEWLENYLYRPVLGADSRERLTDLVRTYLQAARQIFQEPEEYWVEEAAAAYTYQDRPLYMSLDSPFTQLREMSRLRWRLEGPSKEALEAYDRALDDAAAQASAQSYEKVLAALDGVKGEMGEFLRFELGHMPPDSWRADFARLTSETKDDLSRPPSETIQSLKALAKRVLVRDRARVVLVGNHTNVRRAEQLVDQLMSRLPRSTERSIVPRRPLVLERLKSRLALASLPVHAALVNNGTKTGVHVESAQGPNYRSRDRGELLDFLVFNAFSGAGPHSFFMKTWSAGLAYSNGIGAKPMAGRVRYYAERCPDLVQTMRFVAGLAASTKLNDPFIVEYSLANAFGDYRGAGGFASRGEELDDDLADGRPPEVVKGFKLALIELAKSPDVASLLAARARAAVGRVVVGLGPKVAEAAGASAFVIGPEELLGRYEAFLKEKGEADRLVRLYPRDFWP
jgi:Zn-dependent M16 (insulinase) family peptidase